MKFHHLLQQRQELLQRTRLANAAFVHHELGQFAARIARGKIRGQVTLRLADPEAQRAWPTLVADEGSQAVIDEHFVDQDVLDLADLLVFAAGGDLPTDFTFRIEELGSRFRPALRQELERAGVELPNEAELTEDWNRE
ncbi:MAG: hypothetical protein JNG83_10425 [Opitutaceae bacterium]|nr:hypothetical protein [Opitutaceae bacterium]